MNDILDLQEFFVEGKDEQRSHVLLHISEPSTPEEKKKGYFFALTEVNRGDVEQIKRLQEIIDDVETSYFNNSQESSMEDHFEKAVEHVNRRGHQVLEYRGSSVHCFVGILRGNLLTFAYHGHPEAYLFYKKNDQLEYLDIIAENTSDTTDETRLFSSLISGRVNRGDTLYIATPQTRNFLPSDRIQKLIGGRSAKDTAEHIQRVLGAMRDGMSYGGIILQPKYVATQEEKNDEESVPNSAPKQYRTTAHAPSFLRALVLGIGRTLGLGMVGVYHTSKKIIRIAGTGLVQLFILATNKGGQRSIVIQNLKNSWENKKQKLAQLPLLSKLLLLLASLSALIFVGSALFLHYQKKVSARTAHNQELVQAIQDKKDAADASVLYGDSKKALTLLEEARALLKDLPEKTREKKNLVTMIESKLNELTTIVQKWIMIQSELVADLSKSTGAATQPKAEKLVSIGATIVAYGSDDPMMYKVNLNTKNVETKAHAGVPHLLGANTPKEEDQIIFLTGTQTIASFNPESGIVGPKDISFPKAETAIKDAFVYNQRLYTLDPATNQIYKHNQTQTGYDKGTAWVKTATERDLTSAVSLAIDGDLFVLSASGTVAVFSAGDAKSFAITDLDPPLQAPKELWTYNGLENLYILEPVKKRIVVLDKTGKLVRQYTDTTWVNPESMVINEEKKTVYVLDQNKILKFGL